MIILKSPREIELMREAGKRLAFVHRGARELLKPGMSTWELDQAIAKLIKDQGGIPSFLNYQGFPACSCISVQLVSDGRIHPARIEEVVSKVKKQIDDEIIETGKRTTIDLGIHGLHPELIRMVGKMNIAQTHRSNQING